jgi:ABC-type antimicrobial peptide transport system permease subunit
MNKANLKDKIKVYLKNQLIASKTNYTGISDELRLKKLICFSLEYDRAFKRRFNAYYMSKNIGRKILFKYDVIIKDNFWKNKQSGLNKLAGILSKLELEIQDFESRISKQD